MKIKRLNKLIIGSFIGPFFITFILTLFLFMMQFFWKWIDELIGKGVDWWTMTQFIFYVFIQFIPTALPLAILLASIMTLGNLGEKNELTALKAAGLSFLKIIRPLLYVTMFLAAFNFYFANNIFPKVYLNMRALLYDITQKKPALNIKEQIFYKEIDGFAIRVKTKDKDGKGINDVIIYDHSDPENLKAKTHRKIVAKKGKMELTEDEKYLKFELEDGIIYENAYEGDKIESNHPHRKYEFSKMTKLFDLSSFALKKTKKDLFTHHYEMMTVSQLQYWIDSLNKRRKNKIFADQIYFSDNYYLTRNSDQIKRKNEIPKSDSTLLSYSASDKRLNKFNFDSIPVKDQIQIIGVAKNTIRNINHHNETFISKLRDSSSNDINKAKIEWHRKFSVAVACILLFFIGAPFGAIAKKGGLGLPVVFSVIFFIVYYVIGITTEKMIKPEGLTPFTGIWISTLVISPFAIILTIAANNDISLLSSQGWKDLIKKIINR